MANRRMFAKSITNSSKFLTMPLSSQALYFHLGMNADDDGYCEHEMVLRFTGAQKDDLKVLAAKGFVHVFDEYVLIIREWKENNYIQADRYTPSKYQISHPAPQLEGGIQDVYIPDTQVRLGKDRIGKDSKEESTTPAVSRLNTVKAFLNHLEEVRSTAKEKYPDKNVDKALEDFIGYIESRHTKYKDFKLAFFNWVRSDKFNQYRLSGITQSGAVRADTSKYKGK